MATFKANGGAVQVFNFLTYAKAYCANGTILRNYGHGWKRCGRVKAHLTVAQAIARQADRLKERRAVRPDYYAFQDLFHSCVSLRYRDRVLTLIDALQTDPDGVWGEAMELLADGRRPMFTVEQAYALCAMYRKAVDEQRTGAARAGCRMRAETPMLFV